MTAANSYQEIRRALGVFVEPDDVVEIRALEAPDRGREVTKYGYFNDLDLAAAEACKIIGAAGVYFTPNEVKPAALARAKNRIRVAGQKAQTTSDSDIKRRRWLLIDADVTGDDRVAGVSSTDAEHGVGLARAETIYYWLIANGVEASSIVRGDSGNGGHLAVRVELPADDGGLVARLLTAISFWFTDDQVKVDQSVKNPARIWKMYGTVAGKGDDVDDRPHRMARLLDVPDTITITPVEVLEKIAATIPQPDHTAHRTAAYTGDAFDLDQFITTHRLDVTGPTAWEGGERWIFSTCPWNDAHTNRSAYLLRFRTGAIAAGCHHDGCQGRKWADLREMFEPKADHVRGQHRAESHRTEKESGTPHQPIVIDGNHATDWGNARRLVARHGADIRYSYPLGKWLVWGGRRWRIDDAGEVERYAKATVAAIYAEASALDDEADRKALAKHALKSEAEGRIQAMINLARSEPGIAILPSDLDGNPWALNVMNGTLNLRTGELHPHRREDYITKLAPVAYDPNAKAEMWERFLDRVMGGNKALKAFLQRMAGYCLTGDISERCLFICYGGGKNGKTTFIEMLAALLGDDYAFSTPVDTLMARREESGGGIPNDVARLKGARLVYTAESAEGRRLNEERVKAMTGGDTISARFMRGEWFDFRPEFKAFLSTNHKPVIRGTDEAVWDRLRLIPFAVRFYPADEAPDPSLIADPELPVKLRGELAGILTWAVAGLLDWHRNRLSMPREVKTATAGYRNEMDTLGQFFDDCCVRQNNAEVGATPLYNAYKDWCAANGERVIKQTAFGLQLVERGFERGRDSTGHVLWLRIGLLATGVQAGVSEGSEGSEPISGLNSLSTDIRELNRKTLQTIQTLQTDEPRVRIAL